MTSLLNVEKGFFPFSEDSGYFTYFVSYDNTTLNYLPSQTHRITLPVLPIFQLFIVFLRQRGWDSSLAKNMLAFLCAFYSKFFPEVLSLGIYQLERSTSHYDLVLYYTNIKML